VAVVQQHAAGLAEVFGHWRGAGGEEGGASEADGVATVHAMRRAQAAGSGGELLRHLAAAGCGPQQPPVAMPPLQPAQPAQEQAAEGGGCRGCCDLNDLLHLLQATHITGADFSAGDASDLFREVTHLRCEPRVCAANRDSPIVFDTWVCRAAPLGLQPPHLSQRRARRVQPRDPLAPRPQPELHRRRGAPQEKRSSTGLTPRALRVQVRFFVRLSAVLLPELGAARRAAHLFSYLLVHTRIDQDARRGIGLDGRRVGRTSMDAADEGAARRLGDAGTAPHRFEAAGRVATADGGPSCAGGREPESSGRRDAAAAAVPAAAPGSGPGPGREHAQRRPQAAGGASSSASERSGGRSRKGRYLLKPPGGREESFSRARRYSRDSAGSR